MVRAVDPLYVPEKVRVESVAERSARLEPRAIPETVELASIALEIAPLSTVQLVPLQVNEPKSSELSIAAVTLSTVRALLERVSPAPVRSLKDSPLIKRLVVDAEVKEP